MIKEQKVLGLTSAATVWVVAAVGIAFGAGYYVPALAAAVITFFVLRLPW